MVYTWADVTFLLCKYLWPRGHLKGSGRWNKPYVFQPKILYKVIITKDRVNGVCGIACTYIQEAEKVSKFYNVTCYGSQIRAFVRSKKPICPNRADYGHAIGSFLKNKFWSFEEWVSRSTLIRFLFGRCHYQSTLDFAFLF